MPREIITLQVGQCGNQLGCQLFDTLARECNGDVQSMHEMAHLFRYSPSTSNGGDDGGRLIPRCVLIDMEPKVIENAVAFSKRSKLWSYDDGNAVWQQSGSANNWAYGYAVHSQVVGDRISEAIRHEVSRASLHSGFNMLQSLAGGTGSGIGCFVSEILRDEYPKSFVLNSVVAPFQSGDVSLQYYNASLAFRAIHCSSDALILFENDVLQDTCKKLLRMKNVDMTSMNVIAANALAQVLMPCSQINSLPVDSKSALSYTSSPPSPILCDPLVDLVSSLVSHPSYKMCTTFAIPQLPVKSAAYSSYPWSMLIKHLSQMVVTGGRLEDGLDWSVDVFNSDVHRISKCVSNVLFARGFQAPKPVVSKPSSPSSTATPGPDLNVLDLSVLTCNRLYPSWQTYPLRVGVHTRSSNVYARCGVVLSNSSCATSCLNYWSNKGQEMFRAKAFMHHYQKFGVEESDFIDAFATLEQVIQDYGSL